LGAEITLVQADVSDTKQMAQALQEINTHYPLRGIIHSVGVLDDGAILRLSWERFMKVLAPKMWGAWNLHQLTRQMPLDFFILFSSSTGLFGNPGQANHAAANTFLDAFAHYRVHQNLPALTIIWGFWSEIGATAEMMRSGRFIPQPGEAPIAPEQGLEILAHLLQHPSREPLIAAKPIDWKPFLAGNVKLNTPFFETFALPATTPTPTTNQSALQQQLSQASADERYEILENLIKSEIELIVGRAPTDEQDFSDMGIDSLMSIQLANRLSAALQTSLPATITLEYATVKKLTRYLAELLAVEEKPQITLEMGLLANDKIDSSIKPKLEPADNQAEPTRLIQATLIPLQPHGEQQPFFCIPSLGSHATNLYKLAQTLGEKRPVYGFQAVGLDGQNTPHQTVEEMANFYMQCLKTIQPQGPYLLGGHSLGGKIAFEIARQLHQQGDKINQVIMIDSAAPPYLYNTVANETELFLSISHFYRFASGKNLIISSSKLQKLDRHQKIHYLHEQFQQAGLIAPNGDVSQIIGIVQVFEAMLNFNYNPPPEKYPWPITLIQANDLLDDEIQLGEDRSEPSWGWQKFTLESVDVHHVPGNHFTMLQSPHVERLGDLLRDCLQS